MTTDIGVTHSRSSPGSETRTLPRCINFGEEKEGSAETSNNEGKQEGKTDTVGNALQSASFFGNESDTKSPNCISSGNVGSRSAKEPSESKFTTAVPPANLQDSTPPSAREKTSTTPGSSTLPPGTQHEASQGLLSHQGHASFLPSSSASLPPRSCPAEEKQLLMVDTSVNCNDSVVPAVCTAKRQKEILLARKARKDKFFSRVTFSNSDNKYYSHLPVQPAMGWWKSVLSSRSHSLQFASRLALSLNVPIPDTVYSCSTDCFYVSTRSDVLQTKTDADIDSSGRATSRNGWYIRSEFSAAKVLESNLAARLSQEQRKYTRFSEEISISPSVATYPASSSKQNGGLAGRKRAMSLGSAQSQKFEVGPGTSRALPPRENAQRGNGIPPASVNTSLLSTPDAYPAAVVKQLHYMRKDCNITKALDLTTFSTISSDTSVERLYQAFVRGRPRSRCQLTRVCWSASRAPSGFTLVNKFTPSGARQRGGDLTSQYCVSCDNPTLNGVSRTSEEEERRSADHSETSFDVIPVAGSSLEAAADIARAIFHFTQNLFKLWLDSLVVDVVRSAEDGVWYFLQVKSFTLRSTSPSAFPTTFSPRKGEALEDGEEEWSQDKGSVHVQDLARYSIPTVCHMCGLRRKKHELVKVVNQRMMLETQHHMRKRGLDVLFFNPVGRLQLSSNCPVCSLCYSLYLAEKELIEVELELARAVHQPMVKNSEIFFSFTGVMDAIQPLRKAFRHHLLIIWGTAAPLTVDQTCNVEQLIFLCNASLPPLMALARKQLHLVVPHVERRVSGIRIPGAKVTLLMVSFPPACSGALPDSPTSCSGRLFSFYSAAYSYVPLQGYPCCVFTHVQCSLQPNDPYLLDLLRSFSNAPPRQTSFDRLEPQGGGGDRIDLQIGQVRDRDSVLSFGTVSDERSRGTVDSMVSSPAGSPQRKIILRVANTTSGARSSFVEAAGASALSKLHSSAALSSTSTAVHSGGSPDTGSVAAVAALSAAGTAGRKGRRCSAVSALPSTTRGPSKVPRSVPIGATLVVPPKKTMRGGEAVTSSNVTKDEKWRQIPTKLYQWRIMLFLHSLQDLPRGLLEPTAAKQQHAESFIGDDTSELVIELKIFGESRAVALHSFQCSAENVSAARSRCVTGMSSHCAAGTSTGRTVRTHKSEGATGEAGAAAASPAPQRDSSGGSHVNSMLSSSAAAHGTCRSSANSRSAQYVPIKRMIVFYLFSSKPCLQQIFQRETLQFRLLASSRAAASAEAESSCWCSCASSPPPCSVCPPQPPPSYPLTPFTRVDDTVATPSGYPCATAVCYTTTDSCSPLCISSALPSSYNSLPGPAARTCIPSPSWANSCATPSAQPETENSSRPRSVVVEEASPSCTTRIISSVGELPLGGETCRECGRWRRPPCLHAAAATEKKPGSAADTVGPFGSQAARDRRPSTACSRALGSSQYSGSTSQLYNGAAAQVARSKCRPASAAATTPGDNRNERVNCRGSSHTRASSSSVSRYGDLCEVAAGSCSLQRLAGVRCSKQQTYVLLFSKTCWAQPRLRLVLGLHQDMQIPSQYVCVHPYADAYLPTRPYTSPCPLPSEWLDCYSAPSTGSAYPNSSNSSSTSGRGGSAITGNARHLSVHMHPTLQTMSFPHSFNSISQEMDSVYYYV